MDANNITNLRLLVDPSEFEFLMIRPVCGLESELREPVFLKSENGVFTGLLNATCSYWSVQCTTKTVGTKLHLHKDLGTRRLDGPCLRESLIRVTHKDIILLADDSVSSVGVTIGDGISAVFADQTPL